MAPLLNATSFINAALREEIGRMVALCTIPQVEFLNRIHDLAPWKGLNNCPDDDLRPTFDLLVRTIEKNRADDMPSASAAVSAPLPEVCSCGGVAPKTIEQWREEGFEMEEIKAFSVIGLVC